MTVGVINLTGSDALQGWATNRFDIALEYPNGDPIDLSLFHPPTTAGSAGVIATLRATALAATAVLDVPYSATDPWPATGINIVGSPADGNIQLVLSATDAEAMQQNTPPDVSGVLDFFGIGNGIHQTPLGRGAYTREDAITRVTP